MRGERHRVTRQMKEAQTNNVITARRPVKYEPRLYWQARGDRASKRSETNSGEGYSWRSRAMKTEGLAAISISLHAGSRGRRPQK